MSCSLPPTGAATWLAARPSSIAGIKKPRTSSEDSSAGSARSLAGLGYQPSFPLWYYTVDFTSPEYKATKQRASQANGVVIRPIDKKRWDRELETFLLVFNETFKDESEFQPMTIAEFHEDGFKEAFYYPVNEQNTRSRKFAESLGGAGRVLAHCFTPPHIDTAQPSFYDDYSEPMPEACCRRYLISVLRC
jgi:hypothetical protein